MITTPEQQAAAAEAARKDTPPKDDKKDEVKPNPESMAGSPSKLQTPATPQK